MKLHPAAWSLFLLLATGLVVAGFYAAQPREEGTPSLRVTTTEGRTFDLEEERGHVVVLDFFQVWCKTCKDVEAAIKANVDRWNASLVRVVGVGIAPANDLDTLRDYADERNLTWTMATDDDGAQERYGVYSIPTVFVVDPTGEIVYHSTLLPGADELDDVVRQAAARERVPVAFARFSIWGLAVVGAVASFFSPCAIGLLPGYVAHTIRFPGESATGRMSRAATLGVVAASGLLLVFLGLGGLALAFGGILGRYLEWLSPFVGVVFILVGLLLLLRPYSMWLQRIFSPLTQIPSEGTPGERGRLSYFLYGIGYGAGAAGCTAPVLLSLTALAYQQGPAKGVGIILVYAGTAALLMALLTVVVAGGRAGVANWIRRNAKIVEVVSALFFVGAGAFLLWFAWRVGSITV